MNRNTESHFSSAPSVNIPRSKFPLRLNVKTSFNIGQLVPLCKPLEILPGDSLQIKTSKVLRMPALITPIMDNIVFDTYFFFVPNRLVHNHWKNIMGENSESAWLPQNTYSVPQVTAPATTGWTQGTIADYFGIPIGVTDISVNAYPFRGYALCVQEWFRSQDVQDPPNIPVDDTTVTGSNGSNYITDLVKGGMPFIVNKLFDQFTGCTRAPQKGPDVTIPVASLDPLPVVTGDAIDSSVLTGDTLTWSGKKNNISLSDMYTSLNSDSTAKLQVSSTDSTSNFAYPNNLWAIQSGVASAASINELRMAFQIQKLFERDTYGTRYREILANHFSVRSPDARMQIPEYLGGNRISLRISQVLQQSETGTTPQGTPTGVSLTVDSHNDVNKSFVEHGFVLVLGCARYAHSYSQGLDPLWSRKDRFDYFWPVLSTLGNQAVTNKEIFAQGSSVVDSDGEIIDDQVFAYQEAWYSYRYQPDMLTSLMRPTASASLDVWHLGDEYASLPSFSSSWLQEDKTNVDRVLSVTSAVTHQIFGDFHFSGSWIRCMPFYSIPGLIDHH